MALHHSQRPGSRAQRNSFDEVAADYDAVRPGYPEALIEVIIALSQLPGDGHILEIGCGAAQATLPFAERGYAITALDLGASMVQLARKKLEPFPKASVQQGTFEEFEAEPESFDLVMAATAWHWVDREVGYAKAAQLLKPSGSLAIFTNLHPRPFTGFFETVQPIYDEIYGPTEPQPTTEESIRGAAETISSSGHFRRVEIRTYPWARRYTTAEYLRLLSTYSDQRALEPETRERLFSRIAEHLDSGYGGIVEKPYLSTLFLARKV